MIDNGWTRELSRLRAENAILMEINRRLGDDIAAAIAKLKRVAELLAADGRVDDGTAKTNL